MQGVPLSTSSYVNGQGVSHSIAGSVAIFTLEKFFWNAGISDCPASSLFSTGMNKYADARTSLVPEQWEPVCYWNALVPNGDRYRMLINVCWQHCPWCWCPAMTCTTVWSTVSSKIYKHLVNIGEQHTCSTSSVRNPNISTIWYPAMGDA